MAFLRFTQETSPIPTCPQAQSKRKRFAQPAIYGLSPISLPPGTNQGAQMTSGNELGEFSLQARFRLMTLQADHQNELSDVAVMHLQNYVTKHFDRFQRAP